MTPDQLSLIFFEDFRSAEKRLQEGGRLVHYTSAESAARIIEGRQVWLRNALLMNDFSEIEHGLGCLYAAWSSAAGHAFQAWLDETFPGLRSKIEATFDQQTYGLRVATFMMSLSEHDNSEDQFGRLSMWRAYGGKCGVALVLNPTAFVATTDEIKVYSAPVRYMLPDEFVSWFGAWSEKIMASRQGLQAAEHELLMFYFLFAFRVFALCTKHPGFAEEREWRMFHSPLLDGTSEWLDKSTEIVGGLPQEVVKLRLKDDPEKGIAGVDPVALFNRIIIGPTAHPLPVYHALFNLLLGAGIEDPGSKIFASNIPLRD